MKSGDTVKIIGGKHQKQFGTFVGKITSTTSKFSVVSYEVPELHNPSLRVANKFIKPVEAQVNETGEEEPNLLYEEWGVDNDVDEEMAKEEKDIHIADMEKDMKHLKEQLVKTQELLANSINNDKLIKVENNKLKELLLFYL